MEVRLKVLVGSAAGQEIAVSGPSFLIGRSAECNLRPKSEFISRRHCEIMTAESKAYVRDLASRTGTFVNGRLIPAHREVELQAGDALKVGPLEFGVVFRHGLKKKKNPKVEGIAEAAAAAAAVAEEIRRGNGDDAISEWLQADEDDESVSMTITAEPGQTLVSAADLIGSSGDAAPKEAEKAAPKVDPRDAAAEALRKHLRRG